MWIRSQNKYTLINTNVIRVYEDDRDDFGDHLICGYLDGYDHELGVYSTIEKALIVLDQIQYNMEPFEHEPTMVFQMPADDEVEV